MSRATATALPFTTSVSVSPRQRAAIWLLALPARMTGVRDSLRHLQLYD